MKNNGDWPLPARPIFLGRIEPLPKNLQAKSRSEHEELFAMQLKAAKLALTLSPSAICATSSPNPSDTHLRKCEEAAY